MEEYLNGEATPNQVFDRENLKTLNPLVTLKHGPVGAVCDGKDVWGHLVSLLPFVHVDHLLRVDGQPPVGVHHHAKETGVRLVGKKYINVKINKKKYL